MSEPSSGQKFFESLVGSQLSNRYKLLSILGAGGWGVVYKAHDSRIDRTVAIKMLRSNPQLEEAHFARFEREAMAASKLNHPHIITIYDLIWEENPYLVMDYIEGVSLHELLQSERRLSEQRALNIFVQACDALMHAHRKGVIHRDIKPSNLMLTKDDEGSDFLKIVDFGIARLIEGQGSAVQLTTTGTVFGTPTYMSPEQCMGQKLDRRTDIYSFGCVMYETLTGELPIVGASALALIHAHINQAPPAFYEVCSELSSSGKIEQIVLKALAKDVNSRYQSMQELKEDLVDRMQGRHSSGKIQVPKAESIRAPLESKDRARAELGRDARHELEKKEKALHMAIQQEGEQKGKDSPSLVPMLEKLAELYAEFGEYQNAEREYTRAIKLFRQHYGNSLGTAELMRALAKLYFEQERYEESELGYRAVLDAMKTSLGTEDQEIIYCYEDLATVLCQLERYAEAEQCLHEANTILNKVFGIRHIEFAYLQKYFADLYASQENDEKTEQYLKRALSVAEEVLEHNDLQLVTFLQELANLKIDQDKTEEAKQLLKRAFAIVNNPEHEEAEALPAVCLSLGEIYLAEEDFAKAERFFRTALDSSQAIYGSDSFECYDPLIYLGDCALEKGRFEAAGKFYRQAHEIATSTRSEDDPVILVGITRLAQCLQTEGLLSEAEKLFRQALEMATQILDPDSLECAVHSHNLGHHYTLTRRYFEAEPLLRQALRIYEREYERNDEELLPVLETMFDVCRHLGKTQEAKQLEDWLDEFDT